ncbi:hypothetical protein BCV70DRAFT_206000 [Testicularia cyperi]|uniref:Uncharacterized protein n=1 Tax=Testicularia cyperi TaxID=1882483 RepID=A0A317XQH5_9BASI|nr:hypothetical protein BCV70DRAFT_206000 [Testicularia cyperi]
MIGKSISAFAVLAGMSSLLSVFAQIENTVSVPTHFNRDDEVWKKWCQGGGKSGHACFHILNGSPDAYTVPSGRLDQLNCRIYVVFVFVLVHIVILYRSRTDFGVACQTTENPLRVSVDHVGSIDVKGPAGERGCSVTGDFYGTNFTGIAGSGDLTVGYPLGT